MNDPDSQNRVHRDRYFQIVPLFEEPGARSREIRGKERSFTGLPEPQEQDEDIGAHDGEDEPDAHPEPHPLREEEGRPQEPDQADEPEEEQGPQGTYGNHSSEEDLIPGILNM